MNFKLRMILAILFLPFSILAQSTFLNQNVNDNHFVDRIEILNQNNTHLNFSSTKPFNRKYVIQETELLDSFHCIGTSKADQYNLSHLYYNNKIGRAHV